ncbi:MAG: hypothetical protein ACPGGM_05660, partial [Porticoccaceae bacterium]
MVDILRKYQQTLRSGLKLNEKVSLTVDLLLLFPRIALLAYDNLPSPSLIKKTTSLWRCSKVVMQWTATPPSSVRFRP